MRRLVQWANYLGLITVGLLSDILIGWTDIQALMKKNQKKQPTLMCKPVTAFYRDDGFLNRFNDQQMDLLVFEIILLKSCRSEKKKHFRGEAGRDQAECDCCFHICPNKPIFQKKNCSKTRLGPGLKSFINTGQIYAKVQVQRDHLQQMPNTSRSWWKFK